MCLNVCSDYFYFNVDFNEMTYIPTDGRTHLVQKGITRKEKKNTSWIYTQFQLYEIFNRASKQIKDKTIHKTKTCHSEIII